jgi:hypothetical protein
MSIILYVLIDYFVKTCYLPRERCAMIMVYARGVRRLGSRQVTPQLVLAVQGFG